MALWLSQWLKERARKKAAKNDLDNDIPDYLEVYEGRREELARELLEGACTDLDSERTARLADELEALQSRSEKAGLRRVK